MRLSMEEQAHETRIHNAIVEDMMDKQLYEQRRANVLCYPAFLVATTATAVAASAPRYRLPLPLLGATKVAKALHGEGRTPVRPSLFLCSWAILRRHQRRASPAGRFPPR